MIATIIVLMPNKVTIAILVSKARIVAIAIISFLLSGRRRKV